MLPTPAARDWKSGASKLMDVNSRPLNEVVVNLLPTPKASDGTHGGPNQRDSSGRYYLPGQPVRVDAQWLGSNGKDYGPAVRRWEEITGHLAPCPTEPGTKGNRRLSPAFSEWMMGVEPGHVTDIVTDRNDALHVIGNGVVPRQAEAAFRFLMDDENWTDDMSEETTEQPVKTEKPRGKCTGCQFSYQLGTARTGEHKGKLVIRKHNSRTGPGLCPGALEPARIEHAAGCTEEQRFGPSVCSGCCDDPEQVPVTHVDTGLDYPDVVGVAPGGTPIVAGPTDLVCAGAADPFTGPAAVQDMIDDLGSVPVDPHEREATSVIAAVAADDRRAEAEYEANMRDLARSTLPPHTVFAPDAQITVEAPPVVTVPWVRDGETVAFAVREYGSAVPAPLYTDPNASRYEQDDNPGTVTSVPALDPFTAPAPASLIPESSTTVSGQPEPDRDRWGRYLIMGTAHTRATTFAKLGANTKAIEAWNECNVIRGLTLRPDLLMLANGLEVKRDRNDLNSIAAQAKDAAGSKVAANIGTAYHAFSERLDAGLITFQDIPYQYQGRVFQYDQAIKDAGLTTRPEWIERTTAVRADQIGAPLPVAGTLDRIFQLPDGSLVIGDLKTGSDLSYGEMEIEVQLALYAHGVNTRGLFDWNTKTWQAHVDVPGGMMPLTVRTDIAIVVHLPADGDGCTLYVADIERGWRDAQRLGPLQASLKEKKRFRTLTAADLAPRPTAVEHGEVAQYLATQPAPPDSKWELAKGLISSAPSQAAIAQLYQFALDSGEFHVDQLAVLVELGKDRLDALARG